MYLKQDKIAQIVVDAIWKGAELGHYELHAYCVMSNHVHLLVTPLIPISRSLKALKGTTARYANRALGRIGVPFWQPESYDHVVRDKEEFNRIKRYIENNPVRAGIVPKPSDFPHSSATRAGKSAGSAGMSACGTAGAEPSLSSFW